MITHLKCSMLTFKSKPCLRLFLPLLLLNFMPDYPCDPSLPPNIFLSFHLWECKNLAIVKPSPLVSDRFWYFWMVKRVITGFILYVFQDVSSTQTPLNNLHLLRILSLSSEKNSVITTISQSCFMSKQTHCYCDVYKRSPPLHMLSLCLHGFSLASSHSSKTRTLR